MRDNSEFVFPKDDIKGKIIKMKQRLKTKNHTVIQGFVKKALTITDSTFFALKTKFPSCCNRK